LSIVDNFTDICISMSFAITAIAILFLVNIAFTLLLNFITKTQIMDITKEQFDSLKQEFDAETTRIGEKIEELAEKLKDGGLSAEQEAEVFAGFSSVATALKALGRDPEVVEDPAV
jgi:DNA-binding ferritin-like protein